MGRMEIHESASHGIERNFSRGWLSTKKY